jgi:hypothetical protein
VSILLKVNRTDAYTVCGGLAHFRKPDFLNIVKTNIPLKFKENMINLYLYYFNCWFTQSTDTGSPVLYIPSKSRDLADENSKILME